MIGGGNGHDAGCGTGSDQRGSQSHGGARVASYWLRNNVFFRNFRELLANLGGLDRVCDDENVFLWNDRKNAIDGLLQKRRFPERGKKLLGLFFAAARQETSPPPPRHNYH